MPNRLPIVIWGASGHASVVADIVRCEGRCEIAGLIDDISPQKRSVPAGEVLGSSEVLSELKRGSVAHLIVGIGDNATRIRLAKRAVELGFTLATAVHPRATVATSATIGAGSVVMAGAVINPGAVIGMNAIINTCASVDHDCKLGDGVHICPGAHLAGGVTIGDGTMIGVGAAVRDGVRIGSGCVIGAGSAVVRDLSSNHVAYGVPARIARSIG